MRSKRKSLISSIHLLFFAVLSVFAFLNYSCNGACAGLNCVNGACDNGVCDCNEGYEGSTCNTPWSAKFVGTYEGTDCYDSGIARFSISSTTKPDSLKYDNKFYALIKDGTDLIFPDQNASVDGVEFIFSGTGKLPIMA